MSLEASDDACIKGLHVGRHIGLKQLEMDIFRLVGYIMAQKIVQKEADLFGSVS
jgi:hypothetical protein